MPGCAGSGRGRTILLLLDGLCPPPTLRQGPWGLLPVFPHGPCQGPRNHFLTLLGSGICIPIILLTQPVPVWS